MPVTFLHTRGVLGSTHIDVAVAIYTLTPDAAGLTVSRLARVEIMVDRSAAAYPVLTEANNSFQKGPTKIQFL
jgi:hypothetical protein